ncbi:hypothetical protein BLS_003058 [Venturia inaequalis]|uniref:Uncharacterized protein n=1 Tax=Venturia inaequalis TaxID=5025 RepID=A0A8H3TZV8_VENIN|nr:hypothetical protein BLS_003058 [Venturia inaequalis]
MIQSPKASAHLNGLAADNSFKSAAWTYIAKKVSEFYGRPISVTQCQTKWQNVRKPWPIWLAHLGATSGWTTNKLGVLVSKPEVMDRYYEKYPERRQFRYRRIEFENELDFLIGGRIATGRYARQGPRAVFNEDVSPHIALSPAPESHVSNRKRTADEAGVADAIRDAKRGKKRSKREGAELWDIFKECNEVLTAGIAKIADSNNPKT